MSTYGTGKYGDVDKRKPRQRGTTKDHITILNHRVNELETLTNALAEAVVAMQTHIGTTKKKGTLETRISRLERKPKPKPSA